VYIVGAAKYDDLRQSGQAGCQSRRCDVGAEQATPKAEAPKPAEAKAPYQRTKIRTRNPEKGVYRTLDGSFEIRQAEKAGCWDLFKGDALVEATIKGWDRALDAIIERHGGNLEALNTPPAKPAAPAKAKAADPTPEAKEPRDRRSGATGPAPRKIRVPGVAVHSRTWAAAKVG